MLLAQEGYDIALHYHRSEGEANKLKQEIDGLGRRCLLMQGDLSDPDLPHKLVERSNAELGALKLLVNNASCFEKIPFAETSMHDFDRYFNLHLKAPFFLSQAFAKICSEGAILNLLDTRVETYATGYFAYSLSKKALKELTLLLAKALAPRIRVNGICPGPILAPEEMDADYLNKVALRTPMKVPGKVEDILYAVKYLTQSNYINGELLFVDGGERLV